MSVKQQEMIEYTTQDIIAFLMEDFDMDMGKAMDCFYSSITFEQLTNVKTALYLEGSAYVYEMLKKEAMQSFCK